MLETDKFGRTIKTDVVSIATNVSLVIWHDVLRVELDRVLDWVGLAKSWVSS